MDEDERRAIWCVLRALLLDGVAWSRKQRADVTADIAGTYSPLNERQLESHLRHRHRGSFESGQAIRLRPPARESHMSVLWCAWDFAEARARCSFYVGIWLHDGQFIAFRFEPPERGDNHSYYHSQPCNTMGWERRPVHGAIGVPERNPTWPLPAESSLDLLLCLVVSIHGMIGLRRLKGQVERDVVMPANGVLRKRLDKIMRLQVPPAA